MSKTISDTISNTPKQKIFYIEVLRIIACFAVILLHCTGTIISNTQLYGTHTWNFVNFINVITRFAVPVFLMISGFLSFSSIKEYTLKTFLQKKFYVYLYHYLYTVLFTIFIQLVKFL